jgi:uncharacterized protein YdaU (DUF1376 family)
MAEFPALPLWTDAYMGDCAHLSDAEHGRYLRLLMVIWRAPGCKIPNNDEWLARKFNRSVEEVQSQLRPLVREFCKTSKHFIWQGRLTREMSYIRDMSKKQSDRAKLRWEKENDTCHGNATTGNAASGIAPTPTPTPITNTDRPVLPLPTERIDQISSIVGKKTLGRGEKKEAMNGSHVTIGDPNVRLGRFMNKIAAHIQGDLPAVQDHGWATVIAATDAESLMHQRAIDRCRSAARTLGKGWPRNWPTDGKYFTSMAEAKHGS